MKVNLDIPYPEIRVEEKNSYYADILSQDYAGRVSETTASLLYSYQHFDKFNENKEFSDTIEQISIVEMKHLEILGKIIRLLGRNPVYKTCEATRGECIMWESSYINYDSDLKEMLRIDMESEKAAIKNYDEQKNIIDDKYIKEILSRIILDEKRHLEIFKSLYESLC